MAAREAGPSIGGPRLPVLLVPGAFGQEWVYWNVMQYLLERDGFPVYTVTFPRLTLADLRASAELLRDRVDEIADAENAPGVFVVSHSMGGLIARQYVRFLGGAERVRHLVFLGVPHRGTWTGITFPVLRGTRQVLPGSPFLNALNAPGGADVPTTNIYSRTDFIVFPPDSARLNGPNVVNRCAPLAGHWGLLVSPRVYRWIHEALHTPDGGAVDAAGRKGPMEAALELKGEA